jgi:maleylacetoacetate isomerase
MQSTTTGKDSLHLYTYFRSSCSARLRIALALKGIPARYTYVNIIAGENKEPEYAVLNPSRSIPTLEITKAEAGGSNVASITQSLAALEYLDEAYPVTHKLLPPMEQAGLRAVIGTLCHIIASDTQPVTNLRVLRIVKKLGGEVDPYAREMMTVGLEAYEKVCKRYAGKYSVGDEITMADCCLVPAVWGAERVGVDIDKMPTIKAVFDRLSRVDAVAKSHWRCQEDCPEELRS